MSVGVVDVEDRGHALERQHDAAVDRVRAAASARSPAPRGTTGTPWRAAARTAACTSAVVARPHERGGHPGREQPRRGLVAAVGLQHVGVGRSTATGAGAGRPAGPRARCSPQRLAGRGRGMWSRISSAGDRAVAAPRPRRGSPRARRRSRSSVGGRVGQRARARRAGATAIESRTASMTRCERRVAGRDREREVEAHVGLLEGLDVEARRRACAASSARCGRSRSGRGAAAAPRPPRRPPRAPRAARRGRPAARGRGAAGG